MKVLYLCNVILPDVAAKIGIEGSAFGGWIAGLVNSLTECENIQIVVCSPKNDISEVITGETENLRYCIFPSFGPTTEKYIENYEKCFEEILKKEKPDIVHIFGTEYIHSLAMVNVCRKMNIIDKTLLQIQGLILPCSRHYCSGLPNKIIYTPETIHDIKRFNSIAKEKKQFEKRGIYETEIISKVSHITGRTDFDRAYTYQINPNANYYFCNENLRNSFYQNSWDINKCEKHSIFVSQCNYPLKGFHFLLEALPAILKKYPDTHVYTTGNDLCNRGFIQKQADTTYKLYLSNLIKKYNLQDKITFLGVLDEQKMCERFCNSHLFVSPSTIENSPNSLGEAMLLGVPVVASDVGGVKNMIVHDKEGFIYQHDAPYMLAYYVCKIFDNNEIAMRFSDNAKIHALKSHDRNTNCRKIIEIYNSLLQIKKI